MSRVGKAPINVPGNVEVKLNNGHVSVKGPLGTLQHVLHPEVEIKLEGALLEVIRKNDERLARSVHGLTRSLVNNMVVGVSDGFKRTLNIVGVGYRAAMKGSSTIELSLGYSHPIIYDLPEGIKADIQEKGTVINLSGADKSLIGHVAAKIRGFRSPEPYKGKGVKYSDEVVRRKAGKSAAGSGAK